MTTTMTMPAAPIDLEALALVACPDCNGKGYGTGAQDVVFLCNSCRDGSGRVWFPVALLRWKDREVAA